MPAGRTPGQTDIAPRIKAGYAKDVWPHPRNRTTKPQGGKKLAKRWAWCEADHIAIAEGCLFDEARAQHFVDVCKHHFQLWEGEYAGKPFELMQWQDDCLRRIFGWVRYSKHFGRWVRRFRKASLWVGKKNGKSPTGAAVGLYLPHLDEASPEAIALRDTGALLALEHEVGGIGEVARCGHPIAGIGNSAEG